MVGRQHFGGPVKLPSDVNMAHRKMSDKTGTITLMKDGLGVEAHFLIQPARYQMYEIFLTKKALAWRELLCDPHCKPRFEVSRQALKYVLRSSLQSLVGSSRRLGTYLQMDFAALSRRCLWIQWNRTGGN